MPELTDEVPDRVPTRRKLPPELRIPDNGRLSSTSRRKEGETRSWSTNKGLL